MKLFDYDIGDKVKFIKRFYDNSLFELWDSPVGCPPLPKNTIGEIVDQSDRYLTVKVINPDTKKDAELLIYEKDISCLEIIEKSAIAA